MSFEGAYLPFPKTAAERQTGRDPRRSISERYTSREDYFSRYRRALDELVEQRWILKEDRQALIQRSEQEWDEATK